MKRLDTSSPFDVLVGNVKFPENDISHEECLSNLEIAPVGTVDSKDAKCEIAKVSWVTKNQLLRSRMFPQVQCLEFTCKTNNYNSPLACTTCVDSEGKDFITQTSLLASEKKVAFVFPNVSIIFLHVIPYLRLVSVFIGDGDKQIKVIV